QPGPAIRGIRGRNAHQGEDSPPDGPHNHPVDADAGAAHPLDQCNHRGILAARTVEFAAVLRRPGAAYTRVFMALRSILKATAPALVLAAFSLVHSAPAAAAGDPARGQVLGNTCLGCHGVDTYKNVYPTFSVPRLRGQHVNFLVN